MYHIFFLSGQTTSRYATCTETDFENIVAEWLRFGTQRNKREKAKETMENIEEIAAENTENIADEN